jgi:EAL and modified HD-GYP domain-containing signal transduction protein
MQFVVRQPVFDDHDVVQYYELAIEKLADEDFDAAANVATIAAALQRIPPRSKAIVLCGLPLLTSETLTQLPPARTILAVNPCETDAIRLLPVMVALRKRGYSFELADFQPDAGMEQYFGLTEMVGINPDACRPEVRRHVLAVNSRLRTIARGIATREQRSVAAQAGFRFFQGEYYLHPVNEMTTDIPALKLACLQLLQELRRPMLDLRKLEEIVKAQPSFCYRLLRYLNSAAFFGLPTVTSIRHAMALLGDQDLRRMLTLMAAVASSDGQPSEIVFMSMLRARLCELLSPEFPEHGFMTGLFSLMPMIVNMPLSAMLSVVHLPSPVDKALWGQPGALRMVLDLTVAYERGQWKILRELADRLRLSPEQVFAARGEASSWANQVMAAASEAPVPTSA